jgi:hypothetical protein
MNALIYCKSGVINDGETTENESSEDVQPKDTSDPDDLAAAFFTKQAKPTTLPVKEWVQGIIYKEQELNNASTGAEEDKAKTALPPQTKDD